MPSCSFLKAANSAPPGPSSHLPPNSPSSSAGVVRRRLVDIGQREIRARNRHARAHRKFAWPVDKNVMPDGIHFTPRCTWKTSPCRGRACRSRPGHRPVLACGVDAARAKRRRAARRRRCGGRIHCNAWPADVKCLGAVPRGTTQHQLADAPSSNRRAAACGEPASHAFRGKYRAAKIARASPLA